jgi:hypothetical protein
MCGYDELHGHLRGNRVNFESCEWWNSKMPLTNDGTLYTEAEAATGKSERDRMICQITLAAQLRTSKSENFERPPPSKRLPHILLGSVYIRNSSKASAHSYCCAGGEQTMHDDIDTAHGSTLHRRRLPQSFLSDVTDPPVVVSTCDRKEVDVWGIHTVIVGVMTRYVALVTSSLLP